MKTRKFIKKPIVVEAICFDGSYENRAELEVWGLNAIFVRPNEEGRVAYNRMYIETLEGVMAASVGDYIIKGVHGESYPCERKIFEETYEEVTLDDTDS